jgi:hypothetical protein
MCPRSQHPCTLHAHTCTHGCRSSVCVRVLRTLVRRWRAGAGPKDPPAPLYWGFTIPANILPLTAKIMHAAKLVAVFDIDETLLTACTVDSLQTRLRRVATARWGARGVVCVCVWGGGGGGGRQGCCVLTLLCVRRLRVEPRQHTPCADMSLCEGWAGLVARRRVGGAGRIWKFHGCAGFCRDVSTCCSPATMHDAPSGHSHCLPPSSASRCVYA